MAATVRATPNYSVPPTQNTAPVLEFRCLYTHDLLKKQKKWHDGSLKFHTFNRRVMVYDDVKNYIGDLHYRRDEEFAEGLELQLDRPVKVEVGEPIGRTETDLAPILDRGRGERDARSNADTSTARRPTQRVQAISNTGKPKSLLDVLGASQGRLGRGRLPQKSPFEQRQNLVGTNTVPPSAKRQRIMYGKENVSQEFQTKVKRIDMGGSVSKMIVSERENTGVPPANAATRTEQSSRTAKVHPARHPRHTEPTRSPKPTAPKLMKSSTIVRKSQTSFPNTVLDRPVTVSNLLNTNLPPEKPKAIEFNDRQNSPQTPASAEQHPSQSRGAPVPVSDQFPTTKLRLRVHTPRKKLMYKSLLPHGNDNQTLGSASRLAVLNSSRSVHAISDEGDMPVAGTAHVVNCVAVKPPDDLNGLSGSPSSPPQWSQNDLSEERPPGAFLISSSPMFMSQDVSDLSQQSHISRVNDEIDFILTSDNAEHTATDVAADTTAADATALPPTVSQSPLPRPVARLADDNSNHNCSPIQMLTFKDNNDVTDETCTQQLPKPIASSHPLALPSQRLQEIVSERGILNEDTHIPTVASIRPDNVTIPSPAHNHVASSPVPVTESPTKQMLLRSQSDSAVLAQMKMAPPITIRLGQWEQPKRADQGAWTKLEAFLLFDKWPAAKAKDKPTYTGNQARRGGLGDANHDRDDYDGIDEDIELSMDASVRSKMRSYRAGPGTNLPGIRSARAVLRDEF